MSEYIRQVYGEDRWEEIRRQASVDQPSFSVHQVYPENLIPRLAKKAIQVGVVIVMLHIEYRQSYIYSLLNIIVIAFVMQLSKLLRSKIKENYSNCRVRLLLLI